MTERTAVVFGRVAYDVENEEWVMFDEDRFVCMADLYGALNRLLAAKGEPPLKAGDELEVYLRRASVRP